MNKSKKIIVFIDGIVPNEEEVKYKESILDGGLKTKVCFRTTNFYAGAHEQADYIVAHFSAIKDKIEADHKEHGFEILEVDSTKKEEKKSKDDKKETEKASTKESTKKKSAKTDQKPKQAEKK